MDWEAFFRRYREPDFIPGYTILNKLGSGVFGDVYKAEKTSIGKFYAIKFLKVLDERLSEQVLRELQSVDHFAQVDHPHLVSIEDRGEVEGIPYIVMGYAGDETLKTVLEAGALPQDRAIRLFRQVLEGVRALHEHSIVHFDLKPANIFIKGDVARVGDYGLSKLMSESRGTLSMGRGTPYYMAPEMLRRKGDSRSDVYSLGIIFYEMLTGEVPFKGDSEWEILKKHETGRVVIPESLSPGLAAFLRQALDKDPGRRFKHAGAMLAAFEAVTTGRGTDASFASGSGSPARRRSSPSRQTMSRGRAHPPPPGGVTVHALRRTMDEIITALPGREVARGPMPGGVQAAGAAMPFAGTGQGPPVVQRRRGFIRRTLMVPVTLGSWAVTHLYKVLVILAITAVLMVLVDTLLQAVI